MFVIAAELLSESVLRSYALCCASQQALAPNDCDRDADLDKITRHRQAVFNNKINTMAIVRCGWLDWNTTPALMVASEFLQVYTACTWRRKCRCEFNIFQFPHCCAVCLFSGRPSLVCHLLAWNTRRAREHTLRYLPVSRIVPRSRARQSVRTE